MDINLVHAIGSQLSSYGFRQLPVTQTVSDISCDAIWVRRTWNTNRAAAIVRLPQDEPDPGKYAQKAKWKLLKRIWCFPVLWPRGLQIILTGDNIIGKSKCLASSVDKIDNQLIVLQSIFAVDTATKKYLSARTWGQVVTGKFQDAISLGIKQLYEYDEKA